MTRHIIRIRPWWLRVPLWSLWFPLAAAGAVLTALTHYPHRLFVADFWATMGAVYTIGIDGIA